jgi:hypothetical protein
MLQWMKGALGTRSKRQWVEVLMCMSVRQAHRQLRPLAPQPPQQQRLPAVSLAAPPPPPRLSAALQRRPALRPLARPPLRRRAARRSAAARSGSRRPQAAQPPAALAPLQGGNTLLSFLVLCAAPYAHTTSCSRWTPDDGSTVVCRFGQPTAFGQPSAPGTSGGGTFGASKATGFGQSSGFGQPATPGSGGGGFGTFGQPASPGAAGGTPFGQVTAMRPELCCSN